MIYYQVYSRWHDIWAILDDQFPSIEEAKEFCQKQKAQSNNSLRIVKIEETVVKEYK